MSELLAVETSGNFKNTDSFLAGIKNLKFNNILNKYGRMGVSFLRDATPKKTGTTADSWDYEIIQNGNEISLIFKNSNIVNGIPVVVLLQNGHSTKNGGWVQGIDFINPALKPIFLKLGNDAWNEVTKL